MSALGTKLKVSSPPKFEPDNQPLLQETPLSRPGKAGRMVTCHGCHGPVGQGQHQGSELGKVKCILPHSNYCRGGVDEDESWRACPRGYQYNPSFDMANNGVGFERTLDTCDFQSQYIHIQDPAFSTPAITGGQVFRPDQHPPLFPSSERRISPGDRFPSRISFLGQRGLTPNSETPGFEPDLQGTRSLAQGLSEGVQEQIAQHRALNQVNTGAAGRPSESPNIADLRGNSELRLGVQEAIEKIRQQVPSLSAATSAQPPSVGETPVVPPHYSQQSQPQYRSPQLNTSQSSRHPGSFGQQPVIVQNVTRQQLAPEQRNMRPAVPQPQYQPTQPQSQAQWHHMSAPQPHTQLHGDPNYTQVPSHSGHPSHYSAEPHPYTFSSDPQVSSVGVAEQPGYQGGNLQQCRDLLEDRAVQYCYEWVPDGSGNRVLFRTPIKHPGPPIIPQPGNMCGQPGTGAKPSHQVPPPITQSQQPCYSSSQGPAMRTEFRCCPKTGRQWTIQVPVTPPRQVVLPATPKPRLEWRIHPHTGVAYQVEISPQYYPASQQVTAQPTYSAAAHVSPPSQQVPAYHTHTAGPASQQGERHTLSQSEVLGNVSDQPHADNTSSLSKQERLAGIVSLLDGGVTRKQPQIIDHAKKCPTKWAKQATMSNVNLPLFAWGAVSELESSISGRSGTLSESSILGKLRHLKNVMEVCCLNSTSSDFTSYGWTLARDYAVKVENEVEQRLASWDDMAAGVRTATVIAAQMENPRRAEFPQKPGTGSGTGKGMRDTCTTFNKCSTAGKCDYEVQHPDKKCQRRHECSWCRDNKGQSYNHQAWKCKNKEAANTTTQASA